MAKVNNTEPDTVSAGEAQESAVSPISQMSPISDILTALKEYLEARILEDTKGDTGDFGRNNALNIVLSPVKKEKDTEERDVVITLLRIEEETSRKPQQNYYTEIYQENNVSYQRLYPTSPDVAINLEILISSYIPNYGSALTLISHVIRIMNSIKTAPQPANLSTESYNIIKEMSVSLMNLTFDQYLSMWQTLGGELVPAVAYKIRMVTIKGIPTTKEYPHVTKRTLEIGKNHQARKQALPQPVPPMEDAENVGEKEYFQLIEETDKKEDNEEQTDNKR
ncbi:MAG: DUF4255 domain-containing protein [Bacteroidales bacterium]|nr:DUF4255 domain-containing protein [Bacteroidales bacterium]